MVGYSTSPWFRTVFKVLTVITGGLVYAVACLLYWLFPQLAMYTLKQCSLEHAQIVLCKVRLPASSLMVAGHALL